jgi:hypothetical protein
MQRIEGVVTNNRYLSQLSRRLCQDFEILVVPVQRERRVQMRGSDGFNVFAEGYFPTATS